MEGDLKIAWQAHGGSFILCYPNNEMPVVVFNLYMKKLRHISLFEVYTPFN